MPHTAAKIRSGELTDRSPVLALNQAEARWTSDLNAGALQQLIEYSTSFDVIVSDQEIAGFVLVMAADSLYPNANLEWFRARNKNFWYVDRIVVAAKHGGKGYGRALYNHVFAGARQAGAATVVCEYSLSPLNQGSAVFHKTMGFREVGQKRDEANDKLVSMQERAL